uniref:Piwi domain-containing protein n=1 Tax=Panagrolaimus davidi TaxID=227884 RepID=A0A914QM85_9BILA
MSLKKCISSQWIIKIDRNAFAFQYNVKIFFEYSGGQKRLFLSENNNNYFKAFCRKAINGINELKHLVYAYDGCGSLWTPEALKTDIEVEISQPDLDDCLKQHLQTIIENPDGVLHVSLKKADVIMMTDFTKNSVDSALVKDRPWRTLMEFILSEDAVTRKDNPFVGHNQGCLMETTEHEFLCGLKYREGHYKGCHVINGNHGIPQMSLAMNYCRKVFFPANANFQKFITDFIGSGKTYDDAEILCCGLRLCTNDNPHQILRFENFIGHNIPGGDIFAVMKNSKEKFSLKDLQIIPDQSIPNDAMPKDLKDVDLNKFKPHDRKRCVEEQFRKLNLNNKVTAAFGVTVEQHMLEGTFDDSISVNVLAMNNQILVQDEYGAFKSDCRKYYKRGNFKKVILLATKNDKARVWEDIKKVVKFASNKSDREVTAMVSYQEFDTTQKTVDPWVNVLTKHKGYGNLVITVDETPDSHAFLKFAEAFTGVNTQHLKPSTISGVRFQTLQNIVHKLNIKMGGLNHFIKFSENVPNLDLNNGKIFVMGLDVCHPTGEKHKGKTDEPSFVGLSANYMEHPQEFGNLFFAQKTRQEIIDIEQLTYFTEKLLSHVQKFRAIKTIVLLRDGVPESDYSKVLKEEVEAIKEAAENLKLDVKVVAFIVTKNGNVRHFYHSNNGRIESMPHGSFINFGTRFGFQQFYMTAHRSLIGTAKTIMVTKICDEIGISLHEAQEFLLGLTYLHQIVSLPISLPSPINQADDIAQRGQTLYRILKTYCSKKIPKNHDGSIDNKKLTELLSINNESLPISRYNA